MSFSMFVQEIVYTLYIIYISYKPKIKHCLIHGENEKS